MINKERKKGTGLYVHVPFCKSRCAYCAFVSSTHEFSQADYIRALQREITERVRGEIDTVFVGGGTPSVLESGLLSRIFESVRSVAHIREDAEITVEANPDSFTAAFIDEALACGVNRVSLGVQSLSNEVLRAAGRPHTAEQALCAVETAVHRFPRVSCDLMLGLPSQTEEAVLAAVDALLEKGVGHLSLYALSVEKGTPLEKAGYAPDEDAAAACYTAAYERIEAHGLSRYEVSNFCLSGQECRHNCKYWRRAPYIGVGAAAHSFDGAVRRANTEDIGRYIAGKYGEQETALTPAEALEEAVMLSLRTVEGADYAVLSALYGGDWQKSKQRELSALFSSGFLEPTPRGFRLTENAYYLMNEIIVRLL